MRFRGPCSSLAFVGIVTAACGGSPSFPSPPPLPPSATTTATVPPLSPVPVGARVVTTTLDKVGLDGSAVDRRIDPCADFYQFACGGWLAKNEIPADQGRWSRSFSVIEERNKEDLRAILEQAKTGTDPVSTKIGAYYAACMDDGAVEHAGLAAIEPLRKAARAVQDAKTLAAAITMLHAARIFVVFDLADKQDAHDATHVIAELDQNGLGLPDRDFYTRTEAKSQDIREKYVAHVARMLELGGMARAQAQRGAKDVMALETELAKGQKTNVQRRDPQGMYNKIDRDGVAKAAPHFPWADYFSALDIGAVTDVNVTSPAYLTHIDGLMARVPFSTWRVYLDWMILRAAAHALPKRFVDERFAFEQVLSGAPKNKERWKQCVDGTDRALGELLGQPFVAKRFTAASKTAADEMVAGIREAFAQDLAELDWMDAATKARARTKLDAITFQIGHPSKWRTYDFDVTPKDYAQNFLAASRFEMKRRTAKIGKPLDRTEWGMTPPTVNAYANPPKMLMVFPAGILQPPFFSADASVQVNLGGIGMVIGHELTHHFDDRGSQYDGEGNLKSWWEPGVRAQFDAKATCVADQYTGYEVLPGVHLDGRLTLGENIADIGGVKMAFRAFKKLRSGASEVSVADGFDEDQQFFLSVGQVWCTNSRDDTLRTRARTDNHSAAKYRVNGSLADNPEFSRAFHCAAGTPMRPANACVVW